MKILFLSDNFPPHSRGGAEINAFNLACAMKEAGNEVFVITVVQDKALVGESEYGGLKIFTIYSDYHRFLTHYFSIYNPQTAKEIKKIIQKISPDIAHAHNIHAYISYHSLKIAKKYAKGVFLTAHDTMLFSYGKFDEFIDKNNLLIQKDFNYKISLLVQLKTAKKRFNPFRNILIRHYLKYADKIFTNTSILENALNDNSIKNTETAHYGTDIKNIASENDIKNLKNKYNLADKKIIFFGGRLSQEKGGEIAVRTLKNVLRSVPDAVLLVAGRLDDYARYMAQIAEEIGVKQNVIFTGWLNREEMAAAYAVADVVIAPSIYFDAFNLFNLEAMSAGKPVVGTCFGGTPEVIKDGVTGFVINPFNIEGFADKITFLLNNPDIARKMGEAGQKRALEEFSMERQVMQTLECYQKFI